MFEHSTILYLYVETPLHAGTGSGLGAVDLPMQRERTTGYPIVQASSLKGVLRGESYSWKPFVERKEKYQAELVAQGKKPKEAEKEARRKAAIEVGLEAAFGPETGYAELHAGAVSPGDARLLLFPVRSLLGIFAWTTSAYALARFRRDALAAGVAVPWEAVGPDGEDTALVPPESDLVADGRLVLEEFAFTAEKSGQVQAIAAWLADNALPAGQEYGYWRNKIHTSLTILPENAFRDFILHATEVVTRVQLNQESKTVAQGPWTEEHLPTDTLLYAPFYATKPRGRNGPPGWDASQVLDFVRDVVPGRVQLGGDETVGRGLVQLRWAETRR